MPPAACQYPATVADAAGAAGRGVSARVGGRSRGGAGEGERGAIRFPAEAARGRLERRTSGPPDVALTLGKNGKAVRHWQWPPPGTVDGKDGAWRRTRQGRD